MPRPIHSAIKLASLSQKLNTQLHTPLVFQSRTTRWHAAATDKKDAHQRLAILPSLCLRMPASFRVTVCAKK